MREQGFAQKRLQLLQDITGSFRPGILTALMGVTGAGKTTLLDVLSGRKSSGTIEGDIRIAGYPKVQDTYARISGYCEQTDIHSPQLTIKESLAYSAWLRLPPPFNESIKSCKLSSNLTKHKVKLSIKLATPKITLDQEFVEEVLQMIELYDIRDALVGFRSVSGISNELRKRLTIAVELVSNPSIIFMDEPTSGLDARSAAIVMRVVKNIVNTRRTVVCTIHQPSIDIFEAFDELILMKRGGQIIYSGELGQHSSKLIEYFEDLLSRLGSMYIFLQFMGISNCSSVLSLIATERTIVYRERFAGMYSSWAYSFAQVIIEIPYIFLQAFLFVIITYPAIGFYWSVYKVFWYFYTIFCTVLYYTYLGMLLVSMTRSLQMASVVASFFYTMMALFSGFLIPEPKIPKWWIWCYWICPSSWSLRGLLTSQYGDINHEIVVSGGKKSN